MENKIMETAKGIFSAKNLKRAGVRCACAEPCIVPARLSREVLCK